MLNIFEISLLKKPNTHTHRDTYTKQKNAPQIQKNIV